VSGEPCAIQETIGFLVADARGRRVGRVVSPMYGSGPDEPDALAVRSVGLGLRHFVVPTDAIEAIDENSRVIGLRLASNELRRFL
jgi:hypothetical protein